MAAYRARVQLFKDVLDKPVIDMNTLRELCFEGIPDNSGLRPLCWRLLLYYLPTNRNEWPFFLRKQRGVYREFIDEMVLDPSNERLGESRVDVTLDDHPLNPNPDSKWQAFFKDNEVLLQIDKDVRRLCPDISFFQQATEFPFRTSEDSSDIVTLHHRIEQTTLKSANVTRNRLGITNISLSKKRAAEEYQRLAEGQEAHWEVVERILFIYAKLNPGQGYVQGMNEIIGPIYYTLASDPNVEWRQYAEPDTFFCFTNLMAEIRDFFIKTLDDSDVGIGAMMSRLLHLLKFHDEHLYLRLQEQELKPHFYSFRWITLLLSQEFPLPDVIRVWDSLFADSKRFTFLTYVCCAMILILREDLMSSDFSSNVKLLQNFPENDIQSVLSKAAELMR